MYSMAKVVDKIKLHTGSDLQEFIIQEYKINKHRYFSNMLSVCVHIYDICSVCVYIYI